MQVSDPNNVKIYNLSAGKSLPEWLSDRKRRSLQKKNVDIRRRIELIQDFDMPGVSTSVRLSKDGQYVMATGIYKPRVKCFDVNNLSMKFERCFDSEVVTFEILSEDFTKMVFLQCDRYVEIHSGPGRYYRLRIPKFGHDMKYHYPSCDLYLVGSSPQIYRLNLERGQFLSPYTSEASDIMCCGINPVHHLLLCGTKEGKVEAWDPRSRSRVGLLDCALDVVAENKLETFPSVTHLSFNGGLTMGVGTATGQILLYDIRSNKPFYVKDHMYNLPIKHIAFHQQQELVLSMDSSVVKIWDRNNGKIFTSVEATSQFNDLCLVPNSGMFFLATESPKMQTYYIPSLGPAPRWCSFLDNLTEEMEESKTETMYDDYKFVTKRELEDLGLDHLIGTNLLRAYMHGYFMDIRLYKKAKNVADPFEFEQYRKKKIKEKIEEERANRVVLQKLPKVNKDLALKLMDEEPSKKKSKTETNLLQDNRFKALFENPEFQVDKNAEEYRLLNPVLNRVDKSKKKELQNKILSQSQFEQVDDEPEGRPSSDGDSDFDESSSDDDQEWSKEVQRQHRLIRKERQEKEDEEEDERRQKVLAMRNGDVNAKQPKFFELRPGEEFKGLKQGLKRKHSLKASLGERLQQEDNAVRIIGFSGNREMTFSTKKANKNNKKEEEQMKRHREERKKLLRPARGLKSRPNYWSK
ncbi:nucleolar protein 10 [Frankliniella occidentalis]|uniref:Nucleolar protein 10 n=1 Tax=Frankliniella occidentalis TaxID=133901 RepID=A0A9C6WXN2_FRAOC|nr:nucleolar protein 10 [Frankliniella occidentalis]